MSHFRTVPFPKSNLRSKAANVIYGQLKKAAADLWDTPENNPHNAPALWEDINYVGGYRVIPEVITAALAFSKGERGAWKGVVYESIQDSNIWNPEQFAAGWKRIS